ncbi:phospholipase C, phosphocholine-specific [Dyadobacter sp. CY345]|uniref:phosphocholine-specific phospholipase C n=1 Tax=Dyadobacter sp. CY345 TaxID=2909335 RepID=UPI001F291D6E|nr:phospholipase C, phosphocholine-specific [Dyadobacter sp. CY345]MCF2443561.1 phospholipase C, phosphocholine-specific [Dyadobacter sp. CY345]
MNSRRDFLKKAALLSGTGAMANMLPAVIEKALAINPALGSTFYDAEHIVFLMQENRSFDHQLGTLQGVRGYNDPRAISLPDKNKVWLQTNKEGETYGPFQLNVKDTKVAWMGSIPHGWTDQTDAMNGGKYDKWLDVKKARNKDYAKIPLTMGYCDRKDFPFYYSLADAFTVCDHNFCSSITGTHPNRHYWMTGTVREKNEVEAVAHLWNNSNYEYPELSWKTYPERLQENGVSWKVYQNELTMGYGLKGEESAWLSNFGTNVLEYYKQYNVRLHEGGIANLQTKKENILKQISDLEKQPSDEKSGQRLAAAKKLLGLIETAQSRFTTDTYNNLSEQAKELHNKAFITNINDQYYHELEVLKYDDGENERELKVPKGDVFHQFREDVKNGTLPTVSWLMPPAHFSDHPGQPWFGPWYVSEAMEILLQNPEVWKKTIFIVTYDENDGYFDHMAPYVVPNPYKEHTGKVSKGIDPKLDFATRTQQTNPSMSESNIREGAIGLGYRVPMIVASPWSRGGFVNSEVFDHTSCLQFLENFLEKKFSKKVKEENITQWRRTICGDLTSVFRPYNGEEITKPEFLNRKPFIEGIHQAKFKDAPANYKQLTAEEIKQINTNHAESPYFPKQEKGVRSACPLPYELYVHNVFNKEKNNVALSFSAGNKVFGNKATGSPFRVYAMNPYQNDSLKSWDYSVAAGDVLQDEYKIDDFENGNYHFRVYGPNGFFREFIGDSKNPMLKIKCTYESARLNPSRLTGNVVVTITNLDTKPHTLSILDNSYKSGAQNKSVAAGGQASITLNLAKNFNWYDFSVKIKGNENFEERFAGHVETGVVTKTDPLMGGIV